MILQESVRRFSGIENATECNCKHKLQATGAVFYQSVGLIECVNCRGWQFIKKRVFV